MNEATIPSVTELLRVIQAQQSLLHNLFLAVKNIMGLDDDQPCVKAMIGDFLEMDSLIRQLVAQVGAHG